MNNSGYNYYISYAKYAHRIMAQWECFVWLIE